MSRAARRRAIAFASTTTAPRAGLQPCVPTIRKIEQLAGVTSLKTTQDVWVGADGRVRQIRVTTPGVTSGVHTTTTQTLTLLAYNVPVSFSAPPASLVYSP